MFDKFESVSVSSDDSGNTIYIDSTETPRSVDEFANKLKIDNSTLVLDDNHVLTVKLKNTDDDDDDGLVTNEDVKEMISRFNTRIVETIPIGTITERVDLTFDSTGFKQSELFRPNIEFELTQHTVAYMYFIQNSGNIVCISIIDANSNELLWYSEDKVVSSGQCSFAIGTNSPTIHTLHPEGLYYCSVRFKNDQSVHTIGIETSRDLLASNMPINLLMGLSNAAGYPPTNQLGSLGNARACKLYVSFQNLDE